MRVLQMLRSGNAWVDWVPCVTGTLLTVLLFLSLLRAFNKSSSTTATIILASSSTRKPLTTQQSAIVSSLSSELIQNSKPQMEVLMNKSFTLGPEVSNWDSQRRAWMKKNKRPLRPTTFMVTSSHPRPCSNPTGDHILLKSIKNKMDYCRIHKIEILYNVAPLDLVMSGFWVKLPLVRSAMLSHPEAEWIWWVDSDALFTDMAFQIPLHKYDGYNMVMNGWDHLVYGNRSWTGLNMGVFLIRNCQWSLDLLTTLAQMGVAKDSIGKILHRTLTNRPDLESDDQGALLWLMVAEREKWGKKIYLEHTYEISGFWKPLVYQYEANMKKYHSGLGDTRWPFITHFAGCEFCEGKVNSAYSPDECRKQMERAFNFGDNQVLEMYGYTHPSLNTGAVKRNKLHGIPRT